MHPHRRLTRRRRAGGVALGAVIGTGSGGRVTVADVRAHEALRAPAPVPVRSAATSAGEPSLPTFTASGVDPRVLRDVPPSVRRAVAAAVINADAYRLVDQYRGMDDGEAAALLRSDRTVDYRDGGSRGIREAFRHR
ncbi:hypothetical protein [Modestobacter sp. SYSU DS0290]